MFSCDAQDGVLVMQRVSEVECMLLVTTSTAETCLCKSKWYLRKW